MSTWADMVTSGRVTTGVPIGSLTTYKLGGPAAFVAEVESIDELLAAAEFARGAELDVLVLGRGSNLVVSDAGYPGVVVRLVGSFRELAIDTDGRAVVGGAVPLPQFARAAAGAGFGGVEFYVGIPGTVGGAVTMNAGFQGSETAEVLTSATIFDLSTRLTSERSNEALAFAYRSSSVGADDVVVQATYQLHPVDPDEARERMRMVTQWRKEHQPGGTFNAGSVFKNPEGDYAGRIIDSLGLKGFEVGAARVSERHANFFVADEAASAQDVHDLVDAVRARVLAETGIELETEVRFIGEFAPTSKEPRP